MKTGSFRVVADLDFRVEQESQLLNGFNIRRAHIRGRDDAKLAAALCKRAQVIDNQAKPAPLNERDKHVDSVCRGDFFFKLGVHLWLVNRAGE